MGDNRDNSRDSRFWGYVDRSLIVGKAQAIWFNADFSGDCSGGFQLERFGGIESNI
jgi:signal peptidase I